VGRIVNAATVRNWRDTGHLSKGGLIKKERMEMGLGSKEGGRFVNCINPGGGSQFHKQSSPSQGNEGTGNGDKIKFTFRVEARGGADHSEGRISSRFLHEGGLLRECSCGGGAVAFMVGKIMREGKPHARSGRVPQKSTNKGTERNQIGKQTGAMLQVYGRNDSDQLKKGRRTRASKTDLHGWRRGGGGSVKQSTASGLFSRKKKSILLAREGKNRYNWTCPSWVGALRGPTRGAIGEAGAREDI